MRHVRYITISATYGAADIRVERETAHARSVQHGFGLNNFKLDSTLWFAPVIHMKIIGGP